MSRNVPCYEDDKNEDFKSTASRTETARFRTWVSHQNFIYQVPNTTRRCNKNYETHCIFLPVPNSHRCDMSNCSNSSRTKEDPKILTERGMHQDRVFVPPLPRDLEELKTRIREAAATVTEDMLKRVWEEFDYRLDICRVTRGSHIEYLHERAFNTESYFRTDTVVRLPTSRRIPIPPTRFFSPLRKEHNRGALKYTIGYEEMASLLCFHGYQVFSPIGIRAQVRADQQIYEYNWLPLLIEDDVQNGAQSRHKIFMHLNLTCGVYMTSLAQNVFGNKLPFLKGKYRRKVNVILKAQSIHFRTALVLGVQFKVCHGSLYTVTWLVDEPREFNLLKLPQKCITYLPEKLPTKYGVHSEEYLPIRKTITYVFVDINFGGQHGHGAFDLYCGMLPYATDDNKYPAYDLAAQNTVRKRLWYHTDRTDRHLLLRRSSYTVQVLKFRLNALINRQLL
ncbi:hypothetical protein ANN_23009 [Periplaneta americana]|uniref:Uncharacterized protein n=1 Tax=Periplaneta americana TaxID=6978 RepID=A0ABQ8SL34_PERAM|nr:hypothetical protein ANN_23009 [Periplaneta americana]